MRASQGAERPTDPATSVLRTLLGPIEPAEFFEHHWEQRALLTRGPADRFAALFDRRAFEQGLHSCAGIKARFASANGSPVEMRPAPGEVGRAFEQGATICVNEVQGNRALDAFIAGLESEVLSGGEACFNVYCSPDGHGFGLHLDDHPVWILQIEGRKRWWYSPGPGIAQPLTTVTFLPGVPSVSLPWLGTLPRPDESQFADALLEPGDALYLPQGTWHRAAAVGGSLALTLAFGRATPLDVLQQAFGPRLAGHPELRWNLPGFWAERVRPDAAPDSLREAFASTLAHLRVTLDTLTADDLVEAWFRMAARKR